MPTKRAMIVGVNEYQDKAIPNLKGAENDAEELKKLLIEHGGFKVEEEHYLPGRRATSEAVRRGISQLLWDTDEVDVTLFYFSGHGFQDSYGTGYIAPWDMDRRQPLVHGIDMERLRHLALKSANKDAVVLVLDCCYSGIAADEKGAAADAIDVPAQYFSDFADLPVDDKDPTGTYVLSSSAGNETSRERNDCEHRLGSKGPHPHGVLTFHLLEGLAGAAPYEKGGEISVAALRKYLDQTMTSDKQTFKSYSAGATLPEQIILATAAAMNEIAAGLKKIVEDLDSSRLQQLILGAVGLATVLESQPNLREALDLRERVEKDLQECKARAIRWLNRNRFELLSQAKPACDSLTAFVKALSLERIAEERQRGSGIVGLLLSLVEAVEEEHGPDFLLPELLAVETAAPPVRRKSGPPKR